MRSPFAQRIDTFCRRLLARQSEISRRQYVSGLGMATGIACLLHFYWTSQGFYAISWDESGRILDAYDWLSDKTLIDISTPWLPFYRVVVGTSIEVFPDLFWTPRIVIFLFGLLALWAAAWLAYELFRERLMAVVTAILAAFFSARVVLSLAPLTSMMFAAVVLGAMACLARWVRDDRGRDLLVCALFFALAGTIRYEGWIFAALAGLVVLVRKAHGVTRVSRPQIGVFWVIVVIFPLVLVATSLLQTGRPFEFLSGSSTPFQLETVLLQNPLTQFVITNALSLNLLGLLGAVAFWRAHPPLRGLLLVPALALLVVAGYLLLSQSAQSGPAWRMTAVWSMLLLPFTAALVLSPLRSGLKREQRALLVVALLALILAGFLSHTARLERESAWAFPADDLRLGRHLEALLAADPDAKILIESSRFFFLNVLVASGQPDAFVLNSEPEEEVPGGLVTPGRPLDRPALKRLGITVLVFQTEPLKNWLRESGEGVEQRETFGSWEVFALKDEGELR